ncbi:reverse transcriptase domain-containing protein, partial [Tanacetum coccineum]
MTDLKKSGVTLAGPSVPPPPLSSSKEVEQDLESITDQVLTESTTSVPLLVVQPSSASTSSELPLAPTFYFVIPEHNPHQPPIPYPLSLNKDKLQDKANIQIHSFLQMFKKLYFNISFAEALAHIPKYAKMVKDLLTNKEKLLELTNTPLNENCSVKKLSLPELTPTRMTLELATRTVAYPAGIAEDVFVQVGKFTFLADFVIVDYDVDPRVPFILGRPFLRTAHALVEVHGEELTLRVGDEKLVFNIESTSKYPRKHGDESIHKIDILDITCENHFHEVLNVQKSINPLSGSPTPSSDPVVASLSLSLTPFGDSDFILKEIDTFLASDDSTSPDVDDGIFDLEGDIHLIEELLNNEIPNDLPLPLPMLEINVTLKIKTSIDDPPDLELKDLPPHLEYAFLEGTSKLPVIIAKDLKREEKEQLLKVLKSHKWVIAWKIFDILGIDPNFCTHKKLTEDDFKSVVHHQRRVNPKIHEVNKVEVIKLLDAGLIYPISDSPSDLPFKIMCDASDFAVGAILGHVGVKNSWGYNFFNWSSDWGRILLGVSGPSSQLKFYGSFGPAIFIKFHLLNMMDATQTTNNNSIRSILEKEKLNDSNFLDGYRNLRIVLRNEQKLHHPEEALPEAPPATATIQKNLEDRPAFEILQELKTMFQQQAKQELFETVNAFHAYKQEEGQYVSTYMLKMKAYLDQMERLGYLMPLVLGVNMILT